MSSGLASAAQSGLLTNSGAWNHCISCVFSCGHGHAPAAVAIPIAGKGSPGLGPAFPDRRGPGTGLGEWPPQTAVKPGLVGPSFARAMGSGPRYQILSHFFARCASKRKGHARIARGTRAILERVRFSHFLEKMVASQKNTAMRELRVSSRNVQKSVTQMIIPWATAYRALLVRGMKPDWPRAGQQLPSNCGSFSLPAIATVSC